LFGFCSEVFSSLRFQCENALSKGPRSTGWLSPTFCEFDPSSGFACHLELCGSKALAITPNRDSAHTALNQLLAAVAPKQAEQTAQLEEDVSTRLDRCIELTKAEGSQAASLIADCAPNGKSILAQAQETQSIYFWRNPEYAT